MELPGLNYNARITIDDLEHNERVYAEQFAERTRAVTGQYDSGVASHGIVSRYDPAGAGDTTYPLYVSRNETDPMRIDVQAGAAFCPNGSWVTLTSAAVALELPRQEVGQTSVVLLEYVVVPNTETNDLTRYNTIEATQFRLADETSTNPATPTRLKLVSLADWQDNQVFTPERRANLVLLGAVSVTTADNPAGKQATVDLTRTNIPENRPWFSPVDVTHRSQLGTGSSAVPHSLGLNDLSQGNLTLYQQLMAQGVCLGRDQDVPGVPGRLCIETLTGSRVETDTNGSVTGAVSTNYIRLTRFPVRLVGCYSIQDPDNELLVDVLPGTNLLVLATAEVIPSAGARLYYSTVDAGEPLVDSLVNDELHVQQVAESDELLVAGGRGHTQVEPSFIDQFSNRRARISLGTAAPIPKRHTVLADVNGQLTFTPQHLMCSTRLDDLASGVFQFENQLAGAAPLRVGLTGVTLGASTQVVFRLTGTDLAGAVVTEDVTFDFSNYVAPVVGGTAEVAENWQVTNTVFVTATSITVVSRTADGPGSAVAVYGDLDPIRTDAIRDACPLADILWDGARISQVRDARPVSRDLHVPSDTTPLDVGLQSMVAVLSAVGTTGLSRLFAEDLRDPHWFRLDNPLRFWMWRDGLVSEPLPNQPLVESSGLGTGQDIWVSRAVRLQPGASRLIHAVLMGKGTDRDRLNGLDGTLPNLEYRWSSSTDPTVWTGWAPAVPLADANGANFRVSVTDDLAFKIQFRVKGTVVGIGALQYESIP